MNDRHVEQLLQEWLDMGPSVAPDHVHDAVAQQARATKQAAPNLRPWVAARMPSMNAFARFTFAGAVVAMVAIVGISLLMPGEVPGGRTTPPTSSPIPTPEATTRPPRWTDVLERRTMTVDGLRFSFRVVKSGWESYGSVLIAKSEVGPQGAEAIVYWARYPETTSVVACGRWVNSPETSVDYLANAVSTAPGVEVVEPISDVTIGGQAAKSIVVIIRERLGCDPGYFFNWRAQSGGALWQVTGVGDTLRVWIFDTRPKPFMIVAETKPDASRFLNDEVQQIVESTRFE